MKFVEGFNYQKLMRKLAFYIDCAGWIHGFAVSPIAFILHECKQVVIQFLINLN